MFLGGISRPEVVELRALYSKLISTNLRAEGGVPSSEILWIDSEAFHI